MRTPSPAGSPTAGSWPSNWPTCSAARPAVGPNRLFTDLWANDDDAQYKAAQQVLSGRYAWFEQDVLGPAVDARMMPRHEMPAAKQFVEESAAVASTKAEATAAQ